VELTTTAASAGVSGVVRVCGAQIADWSGAFSTSYTEEFVVHSDSCSDSGCPVTLTPPVIGIQGVDVAFRPVLPGSAFVNEVPLANEILHLPFEDTLTSDGTLVLRDVAGVASDGNLSCNEGACPIPGQASPSGSAALFNGVDEAAWVALDAKQGTTDSLTIAAWIYPNGEPSNLGTYVYTAGRWGVGCLSDGTIRWIFNYAVPGFTWRSTGYLAPLNRWSHFVVVYDRA
jgi:hypothetical protein